MKKKIFSVDSLKEDSRLFPTHYSFAEDKAVLGRSRHGNVLRATQCSSNLPFAVKIVQFEAYEEVASRNVKLNEIASLSCLSHPNIVSLVEVCVPSRKKQFREIFYLVFELCEGGELCTQVSSLNKGMPEQSIRNIIG